MFFEQSSYRYAVAFIIGVFLFTILFFILPFFFSKSNVSKEKISPYECGVEGLGGLNNFGNIQFFLIGVFFLIFDLELLFIFPWAVTAVKFKYGVGLLFFLPFYIFMLLLLLGYVFEWLSGNLDWTFGGLKE